MNKRKIAMGPGAASLILIVVTLSLCVLTMLTLISARNDENLSIRSTRMIEQVYTLFARSEQDMARLDDVLIQARKDSDSWDTYLETVKKNLPEGMTLEEDRVLWNDPLDNRDLECVIRLLPLEQEQRMSWEVHRLIVEEPEDDWEWS